MSVTSQEIRGKSLQLWDGKEGWSLDRLQAFPRMRSGQSLDGTRSHLTMFAIHSFGLSAPRPALTCNECFLSCKFDPRAVSKSR